MAGISRGARAFKKGGGDDSDFQQQPPGLRPAKELKAKSIASSLERMSNMFRGTMLKKTPKGESAKAMSLDELDRPSNCPEILDPESWTLLCQLRRKKIASEEAIAELEGVITETEQVVKERELAASMAENKCDSEGESLESWRRQRNLTLNNTDIVLSIPVGQLETEDDQQQRVENPHMNSAVLLTESVVSKLNAEILAVGESKLTAMKQSKGFRSGTRRLRWEQDRLNMQLDDIKDKWKEIQQTKVNHNLSFLLYNGFHFMHNQLTKENRDILQSSFSEPSAFRKNLAQEYTHLDKTSKWTAKYLGNKADRLQHQLKEITINTETKEKENEKLRQEILILEMENAKKKQSILEMREKCKEAFEVDILSKIMQRNRLIQKIKDQHQLLDNLQEQMDIYMFKSFPSLG